MASLTNPKLATVHSKHGIILDCSIAAPEASEETTAELQELALRMKDQKYGFVDESALGLDDMTSGTTREVWEWLRKEMEC